MVATEIAYNLEEAGTGRYGRGRGEWMKWQVGAGFHFQSNLEGETRRGRGQWNSRLCVVRPAAKKPANLLQTAPCSISNGPLGSSGVLSPLASRLVAPLLLGFDLATLWPLRRRRSPLGLPPLPTPPSYRPPISSPLPSPTPSYCDTIPAKVDAILQRSRENPTHNQPNEREPPDRLGGCREPNPPPH